MIVLLCRHIQRARVTFDSRGWRLVSRVDRETAARAANVTEDVIKSWQYRGWLDEDGVRQKLSVEDGTYDLAEVRRAERQTRAKRGRCHRRLRPEPAAV